MATTQSLLVRLLSTPDLEKIVPRLQPDVLHRVIQVCGLEDSAEFVALATPEQLARVLDVDVWRVDAPGADEAFDADRFGLWLEVLMQAGAAVAAEKLIGLDIDLVIAGLTRHTTVFDHAAVSPYTTLDGELVPGREPTGALTSEIAGYLVEARRTDAWDAVVELLRFLAVAHPKYFHRLMRECVRLSSGPREEDGFHDLLQDRAQGMFDLAVDREARREAQGFVTPAQARAFMQAARQIQLDGDPPPASPMARAYFQAIEPPPPADTDLEPDAMAGAVAGLVEILRDAGVFTPPPRALLAAAEGHTSRLVLIRAYAALHPESAEELAYLANAIVAGCSIQTRPFTPQEASDAAVAICNLGLEHLPDRWRDCDLVTAFQVGWMILHRDVCIDVAKRLIDVIAHLECSDRDIQMRLRVLKRALKQHVKSSTPWQARNELDAIVLLDGPSWAALNALIDECPVMHAAIAASHGARRAVGADDFEFISENGQIAAIRAFMASLPSRLIG